MEQKSYMADRGMLRVSVYVQAQNRTLNYSADSIPDTQAIRALYPGHVVVYRGPQPVMVDMD